MNINVPEDFRLGINTGFAVNRYSEPEDWLDIVGGELGLSIVQLTADMLNVDLPEHVISNQVSKMLKACDKNNVKIMSTFTGGFTRVNHLAHPDPDIRAHWIAWFKRFVDLSVDLGCESMGSHFGIFTHKDNNDPIRRNERRRQNIEGWHEIGEYAKLKGLKFLTWEPMSISREQGETLNRARKLQEDVNKEAPLPMKICLDLDHGDVSSPNKNDTDPYAWLNEFAVDAPLIHLKQSHAGTIGHGPFIVEHNKKGLIFPEKVVSNLVDQGITQVDFLLELNFREREPSDSIVVEVLKESVDFWRTFVKN